MKKNTGPILLIIVGLVLLLSNLNILPLGELKSLLRQWWPLLLASKEEGAWNPAGGRVGFFCVLKTALLVVLSKPGAMSE